MKKMKNDNKGFTLVELIVVLVILAILAAILVPALLGYIDEAKQKQIVLNGKSVYTAAQSVASELYAKDKDIDSTNTFKKATAFDKTDSSSDKIIKVADVNSFGSDKAYKIIIGFETAYVKASKTHQMYTISYIFYQEGDQAVELKNGSWESATKDTPTVTTNTYTIFEKAASTSGT